MSKIKKTGDPALDALFTEAKEAKKKKPLVIEVKPEDYVGVSEERVKVSGVQNSGIIEAPEGVLVPHMTQDELSANEPSRGKGMVPVTSPKGVSNANFLTLLSNAYALYVTTGSYDNESLQLRTGLNEGVVSRTISSPEFKRALSLRGVVPNATGLTREQDLTLLILSDPSDNRTLGQKLKTAGVSYATYRGWMRQPIFKAVMDNYTEGTLSDNSQALVQLEKLVGQGDLAAIKFKLELSGRYDPTRQQNINVIALMSTLFEIVARNVTDASALQAIGEEMQAVAAKLSLDKNQIGA